ncbi:MAG: 50S ribosomal protein L11 methyltransferase [Woeseiaceae bacterium]|nr:50S ribosomal protein L11 methyltransferase [Woeseiaceae bacterium]
MDWRQFVMDLDALNPAIVERAFLQLGAASVTLTDAGDEPVLEPGPGETPLWSNTRITGLFPGDADLDAFARELRATLGIETLPEHRIEVLENRAWEREWLRDFRPMQFGRRLWICPSGQAVGDKDAVVVRLDPGLAFGTGTHVTTALCLEWLDGLDLDGCNVLDYGCGSGVLAIAALKLGCSAATAMDIDPQALTATGENARNNAVADNLAIRAGAGEISGHFDVVIANILAGPLVEFADSITSHVAEDGILALSGVLCEQADEVLMTYEPWIDFEEPVFREQDGQKWSRLAGRKR